MRLRGLTIAPAMAFALLGSLSALTVPSHAYACSGGAFLADAIVLGRVTEAKVEQFPTRTGVTTYDAYLLTIAIDRYIVGDGPSAVIVQTNPLCEAMTTLTDRGHRDAVGRQLVTAIWQTEDGTLVVWGFGLLGVDDSPFGERGIAEGITEAERIAAERRGAPLPPRVGHGAVAQSKTPSVATLLAFVAVAALIGALRVTRPAKDPSSR